VSAHEVPFSTGAFVQPVTGLQVSVVQMLPSLQLSAPPLVHTPAWQVSSPLHTLPSAHDEPFAAGGFWQPATGSQLSVVHTLESLQLSAVPAAHTPLWHVSAPLHTLASAHDVPFSTGAVVQPKTGSQLSVVHTLPSLQTGGVPMVHVPLLHFSSPLQRLPSAHEAPLGNKGLLHTPSVQTSLVHGLLSLQSVPITQDWQPGIGVFWQPLSGWQLSVVQLLPSLQLSPGPAVHTPLWQVSAPLQTLPSLQEVPFSTGAVVQPKAGSQLSVVHTLESLQLSGVPDVQVPPWHVSLPLQTLASAHDVPFSTGVFWQPAAGSQLSVVHTLLSLQL
jgi:hypothetical protein